jgi:hypothetical protein
LYAAGDFRDTSDKLSPEYWEIPAMVAVFGAFGAAADLT